MVKGDTAVAMDASWVDTHTVADVQLQDGRLVVRHYSVGDVLRRYDSPQRRIASQLDAGIPCSHLANGTNRQADEGSQHYSVPPSYDRAGHDDASHTDVALYFLMIGYYLRVYCITANNILPFQPTIRKRLVWRGTGWQWRSIYL